MDIYLCSVGVAFGHWPATVNVTSVKSKKKRLFLSLSSLVLHVSSVSLSVCFVSAYVVLLTYSRCCQLTSNLKVKNLDHHCLVYPIGIACCLDCTFSARRVSKMACRNFCGVTVTPEPQPTYCTWSFFQIFDILNIAHTFFGMLLNFYLVKVYIHGVTISQKQ